MKKFLILKIEKIKDDEHRRLDAYKFSYRQSSLDDLADPDLFILIAALNKS